MAEAETLHSAGPEHSAAEILDRADRGMYRDKASRRGPA
jgi:hypothetical protein